MERRLASLRAVVISAAVACVYLSTPCWANLIDDAAGIVTDPLKLGKGSQNILNSVIRIQELMKDLELPRSQDECRYR